MKKDTTTTSRPDLNTKLYRREDLKPKEYFWKGKLEDFKKYLEESGFNYNNK